MRLSRDVVPIRSIFRLGQCDWGSVRSGFGEDGKELRWPLGEVSLSAMAWLSLLASPKPVRLQGMSA